MQRVPAPTVAFWTHPWPPMESSFSARGTSASGGLFPRHDFLRAKSPNDDLPSFLFRISISRLRLPDFERMQPAKSGSVISAKPIDGEPAILILTFCRA
jgi:hypothetical protein